MEDNEEWFNALSDLPTLSPDPFFDEFGDYRHVVSVTEAVLSSNIIENAVIKSPSDLFNEYEHHIQPRAIDFQRYQPHFIIVPSNIIKRTFQNSTQFYRATMNPSMKKRYKTPFSSLQCP